MAVPTSHVAWSALLTLQYLTISNRNANVVQQPQGKDSKFSYAYETLMGLCICSACANMHSVIGQTSRQPMPVGLMHHVTNLPIQQRQGCYTTDLVAMQDMRLTTSLAQSTAQSQGRSALAGHQGSWCKRACHISQQQVSLSQRS